MLAAREVQQRHFVEAVAGVRPQLTAEELQRFAAWGPAH